MAAGPLGRPRRQERRGRRRRQAMRTLVSTVSMNGVVVIGEGEKDEAPMLFNGERVGDGTGAECDVAVDPVDGTTLTAKGMPNAIAGAGGRRPRRDVRPVRRLLHGQAGHRARGRRLRRHQRPGVREHPPRRQGQGLARPRTSRSSSWTAPATRASSRRSGRPGARIKFISDGDVAGAIMAVREGTGVDLLHGHRRHPRGHHRGLRDQVPGRRRSRASCGRRTRTERQRALDAGHDLDRVLHDGRPGQRRQRLLRRHRHHRRRTAARGALPRGDGLHRVPGDAVQVGHDPQDRLRRTGCPSCARTAPSTSTGPSSARKQVRRRKGRAPARSGRPARVPSPAAGRSARGGYAPVGATSPSAARRSSRAAPAGQRPRGARRR